MRVGGRGHANIGAMHAMGGMGGMAAMSAMGINMTNLQMMGMGNLFFYSGNCIGLQSKLE
jgi:hypothetical protein